MNGNVWDTVTEHPLVAELIGGNLDDLPDLQVHVGFPGRGQPFPQGRQPAAPLDGRVRLYVSWTFDAYLEFAAEKVRASCALPDDIRIAVWLDGDAKVKRVGRFEDEEPPPVELRLLTGPVAQAGYAPAGYAPVGGQTVVAGGPGWYPTTLADAIERGGWAPSKCRVQCSSG